MSSATLDVLGAYYVCSTTSTVLAAGKTFPVTAMWIVAKKKKEMADNAVYIEIVAN